MPPRIYEFNVVRSVLTAVTALFVVAVSAQIAAGAEPPKRFFNLPADTAAKSLRQFTVQSGIPVAFGTDAALQVRTNAVLGDYVPGQAMALLLANTGLVATTNAKTGAMTVSRDPGAPRAGPLAPRRPNVPPGAETQTQATPSLAAPEEAVRLNAFVVESDRSDSYNALNTNSITRFRTELKTIPISADIYTESFMQDLAVTDVESMLEQYSPAGFGGANPSASGQGLGRAGDYNSQSTPVLRGLATGENLTRRNGFLPHWGPNDNYYMERVEVIRGPQALLYGAGGAGGVVNNVAKQARFGAVIGSADFRFDDNGSFRATLDYGRSFGSVAVRVAALHENAKYSRDFAGQKQNAGYVQLAWRINQRQILRISADRLLNRSIGSQPDLTLRAAAVGTTPADPRNNQSVRLLLAQGRATDIVNGRLTWDNVDSFAGEFAQRKLVNQHLEAIWEAKWNSWLSTQLSGGYDDAKHRTANSPSILAAPGRSGNPTGEWAVQYTTFNDAKWAQYNKGIRAVATAEFNLLRGHHQWMAGGENNLPNARRVTYRYYELDASGRPIVNPAQVTNANLGRNLLSTAQIGNAGWVPVGAGPVERPFAGTTGWHPFQEQMVVGGRTYGRAPSGIEWVTPPTTDNPRGVGGAAGQFRDAEREAFFVAGMSSWLDRRLNLLYGLRYDLWDDIQYSFGTPLVTPSKGDSTSYNLGANYQLRPGLHVYYGYSVSYKTNLTNLAPDGSANPPISTGKGHEIGLKFDLLDDRISGSLAYFKIKSLAENFLLGPTFATMVNPAGINGRVEPNSNWIGVDRDSDGVELMLTAQPIKGWRSRLNTAITDGVIGESRSFGIVYNDQFHTDGRGGVIFGNGEPLLVKVNPQDNNPNAARTQLTTAMMNDPRNAYFAQLDPDSGRILNSATLGLTSANSAGATVGTGRVGLPISQHQLNFSDPNGHRGSIPAVQAGLPTTSYAKYSLSWTNNYTFDSGILKGLMLGGTVRYKGRDRSYYYNQTVLDAAGKARSQLTLFGLPDATFVDFMTSYRLPFVGKARCTLQLNIRNAFNRFQVIVLPNVASGAPQLARYTNDPRQIVLTARFGF